MVFTPIIIFFVTEALQEEHMNVVLVCQCKNVMKSQKNTAPLEKQEICAEDVHAQG